jgi:hypothetical protein
MPVDPQLLERVLRTPDSGDISESPIVTAVILEDPANAADLVPALERERTLESRNARRILCLFDADAAPHLVHALNGASTIARKEGLEILWTLLFDEDRREIRESLDRMAADLQPLLSDKQPLPDFMPEYIERDFRGRICDLAYIVIRQLLDPEFDQSEFRARDNEERDQEIRRLQLSSFGMA